MKKPLKDALKYCGLFAVDGGNPMWGYAQVEGSKVSAGNNYTCIECEIFKDEGGDMRLIPLSQGAKESTIDINGYEFPDYVGIIGLKDERMYRGSFIMKNSRGLASVFKIWKKAFEFINALFQDKKQSKCILAVNSGGFYAYATGEKGIGTVVELCNYRMLEFLQHYPPHGAFSIEYLIKACDVLIEYNPTEVLFYVGFNFEELLISIDGMQCQIMGTHIPVGDPLNLFYESNKIRG